MTIGEFIMKNLVLNPGSTSTKIAVFEGNAPVFSQSIRHSQKDLEGFQGVIEQKEYRSAAVMDALKEHGMALTEIGGVIGIGGMLYPGKGGVYEVNAKMAGDLVACAYGEHASNLGGVMAFEIAGRLGIKAYIADPVTTDELQEVARISGMPEIVRSGRTHTLNQKAVASLAAKELGLKREECRLVVAHLGGGISVAAHRDGLIVDTNDPRAEGPFCMDRTGGVNAVELVKLCLSGKYAADEMLKKVNGAGGVVAYLNTRDFFDVMRMYNEKDPKAIAVYDALVYQVAKEIGAMAAVLKGKVDAVVFTGGMAREKCFVDDIREYVEHIAKVLVFPGEFEMEALAAYAAQVQNGEIVPQVYKGG
jgi:butyrate kinase